MSKTIGERLENLENMLKNLLDSKLVLIVRATKEENVVEASPAANYAGAFCDRCGMYVNDDVAVTFNGEGRYCPSCKSELIKIATALENNQSLPAITACAEPEPKKEPIVVNSKGEAVSKKGKSRDPKWVSQLKELIEDKEARYDPDNRVVYLPICCTGVTTEVDKGAGKLAWVAKNDDGSFIKERRRIYGTKATCFIINISGEADEKYF